MSLLSGLARFWQRVLFCRRDQHAWRRYTRVDDGPFGPALVLGFRCRGCGQPWQRRGAA